MAWSLRRKFLLIITPWMLWFLTGAATPTFILQLIVSSQKRHLGTLAAPNQAIGSPFARRPSSDDLLQGVVVGCFIGQQIGSGSMATDFISIVDAEDRICNQPQNYPYGGLQKGSVSSIFESRG